jgi:hypothetical protein
MALERRAWLANFDVHASEIEAALRETRTSGCAGSAGSSWRRQARSYCRRQRNTG